MSFDLPARDQNQSHKAADRRVPPYTIQVRVQASARATNSWHRELEADSRSPAAI